MLLFALHGYKSLDGIDGSDLLLYYVYFCDLDHLVGIFFFSFESFVIPYVPWLQVDILCFKTFDYNYVVVCTMV